MRDRYEDLELDLTHIVAGDMIIDGDGRLSGDAGGDVSGNPADGYRRCTAKQTIDTISKHFNNIIDKYNK